MLKPPKQFLRKTSCSLTTLLLVLVFTFVLSGCGGSGGSARMDTGMMPGTGDGSGMMPGTGGQEMTDDGGQEPVSRELMLNKINEIQATERANNSDDDVVRDILRTAANRPRRSTSSALGPTVSSTSQNSGTSSDLTNDRAFFVAEYDGDADAALYYETQPVEQSKSLHNRHRSDSQ